MLITMTSIGERQRTRFCINKKQNIAKRLYVQKSVHFAKSTTICFTFLYKKTRTLYITRFFKKILILEFIYKNYDTLRYMTFLYTKMYTLRK